MQLKRALVTGASSGIGRELATLLAKDGYEIVLVGRNDLKLKELTNEWDRQNASRARIVKADLSNPLQLEGLVARGLIALGGTAPFSLLVNCAGFAVTGRIEDIPIEALQACWTVNYFSAVSLVQQVLPSMRAQKAGMIVNISSGVARRALPFVSPYCSAKAALNSFSESLRVETQATGISVLLFSPGPVESGFHKATEHHGLTELRHPPLNGQKPAVVAERLLAAIHSKQERVNIGGKAAAAYHLNYWAPKLVDRLVGRYYKLTDKSAPPTVRRITKLKG